MKTATCKKCGIRELHTHANQNYRCASCEAELVAAIARLAADGNSSRIIGLRVGLSYTAVGNRMRLHNIEPAGQPEPKAALVRGFGQPPAKLMPSRHALGLTSVFNLAGV